MVQCQFLTCYAKYNLKIKSLKKNLDFCVVESLKMAQALKKEVLQCFKSLHRARKIVFDGDSYALEACRQKINDEYKKNMRVQDNHSISELIQYSKAVENELRTSVIQAKEVAPGKYEAKITPETVRLDNVPFSECGVKKGKN